MISINNLGFDVQIVRTKNGVAKVKLVVKNLSDAPIDGWDVGLDLDNEVTRSRKSDHYEQDGMTVLSAKGSTSKLKPGQTKTIKFNLEVGPEGISEEDILAALTAVGDDTQDDQGDQDDDPADDHDDGGSDDEPGNDDGTGDDGDAPGDDDGDPVVDPVVEEPTLKPLPEGITVTTEVGTQWDNAFNLEVTITNDSSEAVEGWTLSFALPATLRSVWYGTIEVDDAGNLVIGDEGWNSRIEPGQSITFGLNALTDDPNFDPDDLEIDFGDLALLGSKLVPVDGVVEDQDPPSDKGVETGDEPGQDDDNDGAPTQDGPDFPKGIAAETKIKGSWSTGAVVEVAITNTSAQAIEQWDLAFNQTGDIANIWRAEAEQGEDGLWHISNKHWNGSIEPGETITFGFKVTVDEPVDGRLNPNIEFAQHSLEGGRLVVHQPEPEPAPSAFVFEQSEDDGGIEVFAAASFSVAPEIAVAAVAQEPPKEQAQPSESGDVIHVSSDITTQELQDLVDSAPPDAVLQLEAGTFLFTDTLKITRDDITIKGAGMGETILMGVDSGNADGKLIVVDGGDNKNLGSIAQDVNKGDSTFVLAKNHTLKVGDKISIKQDNDAEYLDSIESFDWRHKHSIRNTIAEVVEVNGQEITLRDPINFDYDLGKAELSRLDMVENVTLSDFTMTYDLGEPDHHFSKNTLDDRYYRSEMLRVRNAHETELSNIESKDSASTAFHFRNVLDLDADNLIANGAHNKGGGGNGYAFELENVYSSEFTNLSDLYMRHGFTMGSWFSSGDNFAHISFTNRDVNFHGGRDHNNVVIVDESIMDNNERGQVHTPAIIKGPEGHWGAPTDPTTNSIEFTKVVSQHDAKTHDLVYGTDNGAHLETFLGNDSLHGGAGDDMLIGGMGNDHHWGGDGADTFVFTKPDWGTWTDVIHDFSEDEDTLDIGGGLAVQKITKGDFGYGEGADDTRLELTDGSEIVLVDVTLKNEDDLIT